jgi:putative sterol carrier protein
MSHPLLSEPWMAEYKDIWNRNETAIDGTKGLDALVELQVTDIDDRPPMQIQIGEDGMASYAGPVLPDADPKFRLSATTETWRRVAKGELGVKRAVAGPVKMQGSMVTAMKHFKGLEAALLQFADVPTQEWT